MSGVSSASSSCPREPHTTDESPQSSPTSTSKTWGSVRLLDEIATTLGLAPGGSGRILKRSIGLHGRHGSVDLMPASRSTQFIHPETRTFQRRASQSTADHALSPLEVVAALGPLPVPVDGPPAGLLDV